MGVSLRHNPRTRTSVCRNRDVLAEHTTLCSIDLILVELTLYVYDGNQIGVEFVKYTTGT